MKRNTPGCYVIIIVSSMSVMFLNSFITKRTGRVKWIVCQTCFMIRKIHKFTDHICLSYESDDSDGAKDFLRSLQPPTCFFFWNFLTFLDHHYFTLVFRSSFRFISLRVPRQFGFPLRDYLTNHHDYVFR